MCSYVAADYMEDLVDCFESFIQKSLLAIIIALAVIVASVMYLLKILSERTLENSPSLSLPIQHESRSSRGPRATTNTASRESRKTKKSYIQNDTKQIAMAHSVPSYDNSELNMVGLSCCAKPCCKSKTKVDEEWKVIQRFSILSNTKYGSSPIIKQEMEYEMRPSRATIPPMLKEIKKEKSTSTITSKPFILVTLSLVLFFTFLLPDFSERIDRSAELKEMKKVLDKITNTMTDIGTAYDTLHKDVKQIVKHKPCKSCCHSPAHTLDRRKQHDINVVTMIEKKKASMVCKEVQTRQNTAFNKHCLTTNASTITRYPLRSTGVGIETRKYYAYKDDCTCKDIRRTIKV
ncbi:unnamed protein product [Pieris macdunnoughi]|uniref:Uncharacterized protein n=1 Tax=Pieris macdunnoughi TaxID=345717 RepID=A0A821QE02_9NEOP|nr:unnamed protein product [Pieris macdunnoughi]